MSTKIVPVSMFAGIVRERSPKLDENGKPMELKLDRQGKKPIVIEPIGGVSPRSVNIMSGTVAESQGLVIGKNYVFKAVHVGKVDSTANEGKVTEGYQISSIGEITTKEAVNDWYREEGLEFQLPPNEDGVYDEEDLPDPEAEATATRKGAEAPQETP